MNDLVRSLVRTYVPVVVGLLVTWGVLPSNLSEEAGAVAMALVTGLYYLAVRLAERRWPILGWLLGSPRQPSYG